MNELIIIGGGKAARVTRYILNLNKSKFWKILGYTDISPTPFCADLNYLGTDEILNDYLNRALFIITVGKPIVRQYIYETHLSRKKQSLINVIHPLAYISSKAFMGKGNIIGAGTIVYCHATVQNNCWIGSNTTINHDCIIKEHCLISSGVSLAGNVHIGEASLIGVGSTIAPDISIGENCIVGSGAVVIDNVSDNKVVIGNPARIINND